MKNRVGWVLLCMMVSFVFSDVLAEERTALYSGFPPIEESQAYSKFLESSQNDYAKIVFLIDRFAKADAKVIYEGYHLNMDFASRFARGFLATQYRDETPKRWIMRWCNRTVFKGELIWVKLPNEKYCLSREILLEEVEALEDLLARETLT